MKKCGNKFCSNPEIKLNFDVRECRESILANHPKWNGVCFYQRQPIGCEECGGKLVHQDGCIHCLSCGWSACS